MVEDIYVKREYLKDQDVTVETNYRLGFDADRTCGFSRVFKGRLDDKPEDENYEIYQELYECGLNSEEVEKRHMKVVQEILEGRIDVDF
ncbi:MAG: hypothetical protein AMDU1_APLC00009G0034 [Thermoplasmatales archaeon A-plasma]|jgi:hypothetical protein|nr:MAG: hypothetical protein AMDU1_APLC00009G0034 [Thermoplasmatales archaeon A-plasma]WMT44295.1 MAG: hypothetical protein RE469_08825 [Cuniculiplasma divulgatum]